MGERELEGLVSVSRPVLVGRLLQLDAAGGVTAAHVRAGAQLAGVHPRTVWRWVEAARSEGRVERFERFHQVESGALIVDPAAQAVDDVPVGV
ncbi:hypothetical protein ABT156_50050, partial [Streptomyces sp. NPDC001833]